MVDAMTHTRNLEKPGSKDEEAAAKATRIEEELTAFDPNQKATERNDRIDGSGARFETDG